MKLFCPDCFNVYDSLHLNRYRDMNNMTYSESYICPSIKCENSILKEIPEILFNDVWEIPILISDIKYDININNESYITFTDETELTLDNIADCITFINKYDCIIISDTEYVNDKDMYEFSVISKPLNNTLHDKLKANNELILFLNEFKNKIIKGQYYE